MNVIISNKYKDELDKLEIDISKKQEGEFEVDELINTYSNYFFNKMIIDITAIKNYEDFHNLQKIPMNLNVEKIIFLLDKDKVTPEFLSHLVSVGIYNFTSTIEGVMYLYNNPNSYSDVVQYQDPTVVKKDITEKENKNQEESSDSISYSQLNNEKTSFNKQVIIGIKNITDHAGATTLTYMLKNELSNYKDVVALEINKKDFIFLRDPELVSIDSKNLKNELEKYKEKDIILLDLNGTADTYVCDNIIYLIEPTTIKLNKAVMLDRKVFEKLIGKKIILNKSLISKKDISNFELETNSDIYYNIPPLDDKKSNSDYLLPLLEKLNLIDKIDNSDEDMTNDKFLGIFNI